MINQAEYVGLGLACADICKALERGTKGRRVDQLDQSVLRAIEQFTMQVKSIIHVPGDLLTMHLIPELWARSKTELPSGANEMRSLGFCKREMIKR